MSGEREAGRVAERVRKFRVGANILLASDSVLHFLYDSSRNPALILTELSRILRSIVSAIISEVSEFIIIIIIIIIIY